jgi:quinol monooxygenase YgiN
MIFIDAQAVFGSEKDLEAFCSAAKTLIPPTLKESGCYGYAFAHDIMDPLSIRITERWESDEALKAHMGTAHWQVFLRALGGISLAGMSAKMHDIADERDPPPLG